LHEELTAKGEPVCVPTPTPVGSGALSCGGLYDVSLSREIPDRVVGNDVRGDGKALVIITGANTGGKSTLLRAIGLAQLMLQAGMFVGAETMTGSVCTGLFTHYKREEDNTMRSGKLDEELARMSAIADHVKLHGMVLFNESFAATNEREGSEIARQIVRALLERDVRVCFVTHFYDLAHGFYSQQPRDALFLRAERRDDGQRTFKLNEGEPLPTSYGADLYERFFGRKLAAGG
jgi:DNA mismatch repair ATPase MutS